MALRGYACYWCSEDGKAGVENEEDGDDLKGTIWMLSSALLFAANTLLIRAASLAAGGADGWQAALFRGGVGILILLIFFGGGRGFSPKRMFVNRLVVMRGLIGGFGIITFYITITELGAGRAIVINLTYPMFGTVIAALWLKEKVTVTTACWLVVATIGLVIFLSDERMNVAPSFYDFVGLAGAFAAGWVVVIIRKLRNQEHPATIYGAQATCSILMGLPFLGDTVQLPFAGWGLLTAGAVIVTFSQLIMTSAYQRLSIAKGTSLQMTLPIFTAVGAFFWFGERFQAHELVGALVTLVAIWRVAGRKRKIPPSKYVPQ
ncbi:MAG: DMT family transporter [Akkermansiaceae bacterium]|nr:DMT family transporter [Akkermansiaceae bacterium]MDP4898858.1 DMT family transporter [Akkermansiaceae bacterium]